MYCMYVLTHASACPTLLARTLTDGKKTVLCSSACCVCVTCVHVWTFAPQVSEGIDFSDKAGRGVVITGGPMLSTQSISRWHDQVHCKPCEMRVSARDTA